MRENTNHQPSVLSYVIGFVLSVVLTLGAYVAVVNELLDGWRLIILLLALACVQLIVQLVFFLHIGKGASRQWNVLSFIFTAVIIFIVVAGSIWIMNDLNYNMMPSPAEMEDYMLREKDKGF